MKIQCLFLFSIIFLYSKCCSYVFLHSPSSLRPTRLHQGLVPEGQQPQIWTIENLNEPYGYFSSVQLQKKLNDVESRKYFIENCVVDNR